MLKSTRSRPPPRHLEGEEGPAVGSVRGIFLLAESQNCQIVDLRRDNGQYESLEIFSSPPVVVDG